MAEAGLKSSRYGHRSLYWNITACFTKDLVTFSKPVPYLAHVIAKGRKNYQVHCPETRVTAHTEVVTGNPSKA